MASEPTHRDLYFAAVRRVNAHPGRERPLEEYLRALLGQLAALRERAELGAAEFLDWVTGGLAADPVPFEPAWDRVPAVAPSGAAGFGDVERMLQRQVAELRRLLACGLWNGPEREFGVQAPGGGRWSNFDPASFVECGLQGIFGGFALEEHSRPIPHTPRLAEQSGVIARGIPMSFVTWDDVLGFLLCGQCYE
jgi:hypothetical protein